MFFWSNGFAQNINFNSIPMDSPQSKIMSNERYIVH